MSTKATPAPRTFKRPGIPPGEFEDFVKEESPASPGRGEIRKTDVTPGVLTSFLSNERSRLMHVLNESLKIPRILFKSHVAPNSTIPYKNANVRAGGCITRDWLLLQRNVDEGIIGRFKRRKSTQSSCEQDGRSRRSRGRVEDHRQSAESCRDPCRESRGRTSDECGDDRRAFAESRGRDPCADDLSNRREYCRSTLEPSRPEDIRSEDKPAQYNDRRACDATEYGEEECARGRVTSRECWTRCKPATEGEIYRACRPKPCESPYPSDREERAICRDRRRSYASRDCDEETAAPAARRYVESTPSCSEESSCTSSERDICATRSGRSRRRLVPDARQPKPDPSPPSQQHWTERAPSYCDNYPKKTPCASTDVEPSPMLFVPQKGPRKSRAKGAAWPLGDAREDCKRMPSEICDGADAEAPRIPPRCSADKCEQPRCVISFEDKCADSLTPPVPKVKPRLRQFPKFARSGRYSFEKSESGCAASNVSDCESPNVASYKYQLSRCSSVKRTCNVDARDSPDDAGGARRKRATPLSRFRKTKRLESRRESRAKGKRGRGKAESPSGWMRQKYKVRLKIFQRGDGRLDACLPRIVELRESRDGRKRPIRPSKVAAHEFSPRLCPSDCPPPEQPVTETKSYPTKMEESRVVRGESPEKCSRKKYC